MNSFSDIVRAVARPVITVIFSIALVAGVFEGVEFPIWFLGLAIPAVSYWFVERTVTHAKEGK